MSSEAETGARGFNHPFFAARKRPDVIAHRGGTGQWPGETIFAFEEALKLGVDVIEMDVRRTRDGELILMHNATLKETTGVDKRVDETDFAEIKDLPATHGWPNPASFPADKVKVPAFREVVERFRGARMNVEIKDRDFPGDALEKFCRLIEDNGMTEMTLVASLWHGVLKSVRKRLPRIATSASGVEMAEFRTLNSILRIKSNRIEADALQISSRYGPVKFITRDYIRRAHHVGVPVHGWTVNDSEEMKRLIEIGVDGIITDFPTRLLELLGRAP